MQVVGKIADIGYRYGVEDPVRARRQGFRVSLLAIARDASLSWIADSDYAHLQSQAKPKPASAVRDRGIDQYDAPIERESIRRRDLQKDVCRDAKGRTGEIGRAGGRRGRGGTYRISFRPSRALKLKLMRISFGIQVKKPARPLKPLRRKGKTPAKRIRTKSSTSVADQIRRYISKLRLTCSRSLSRCLQQLGRGPLRVFVEAFGVHGDTALKKGVEAKEDL